MRCAALAVSWLLFGPAAADAAALLRIEAQGDEFQTFSALSGDGRVVAGWCASGACVGAPGGAFASLLPLDAPEAVSRDGSVVVGAESTPGGERASRWVTGAGAARLSGEPPGTVWSRASGVSADGAVVVGSIAIAQPWNGYAFRWTEAGGFELLEAAAAALAVSADGGAVVGRSLEGGAVLWRAGDAPLLLNPPEWSHEAYAVSDDGRVVVGGPGAGGGDHWVAWRFEEGLGLEELGAAELAPYGSAWDVSADGASVLVTGGDEGWHYLHDEAGLRRVADILASYGVDASAWELRLGEPSLSDDGLRVAGNAWRAGAPVPYLAVLAPACDDGLDNDGDGRIDLADAGCRSASSNSEQAARRCGLGFEIALLAPLLAALRRRRRR